MGGRSLWFAALVGALALGAGCASVFGVDVPEAERTVACGLCLFGQPSPAGCYWAVEMDGSYYAINGATPEDHDAHGPEGMCTRPRRAVVAGRLRGEQVFTTKFELLPVDPGEVAPARATPHAHKH